MARKIYTWLTRHFSVISRTLIMWTHMLIIVVLLMVLSHAHANLNLGRMIAGRNGIDSSELGYWNLVSGGSVDSAPLVAPSAVAVVSAAASTAAPPASVSADTSADGSVASTSGFSPNVRAWRKAQGFLGMKLPMHRSGYSNPMGIPSFMAHAKKMDARNAPPTPAQKKMGLAMRQDSAQRMLRSKLVKGG